MPPKVDATLPVLREIRDQIKGTNSRLETLEHRFESLEYRFVSFEGKVESLERRQVATETRLATELIAVASAVKDVRDLLRDRLDDRGRVDDLERRLAVVERKVG
jgi:vacuolar-type H+-ATPase subunit D/Vma8